MLRSSPPEILLHQKEWNRWPGLILPCITVELTGENEEALKFPML
jgi:hypothetical protein